MYSTRACVRGPCLCAGPGGGGVGGPEPARGGAVHPAVRVAGGHRADLVALLARHHPQELQPVRRQRVRGRHQPLPDAARLPLPARAQTQVPVVPQVTRRNPSHQSQWLWR